MKKLFLITTLFFLAYTSCTAQSSTDSLSFYLNKFDFEKYEGKPVDSLLLALPPGFALKLIPSYKTFRPRFLSVQYPGNRSVSIYVLKYQYMDPMDPNRVWNLALYRKEKLHYAFCYAP